MDNSPESFAYRCLPLNIANAHGWEVLAPCAFDAQWTGGGGTDGVVIKLSGNHAVDNAPVSIFGQGVLTFHIAGLFRTSPGWNLWIGGSPNRFKDAIQPLTGIVETDWSPFTFTMNWRFTRPNTWIHFDAGEPICFIFPVQRHVLEDITPKFLSMESTEVMEQFKAWSKARNEFHAKMANDPPKVAADKWQKHYYRGVDVSGKEHVSDHVAKLRLAPFTQAESGVKGLRPRTLANRQASLPSRAEPPVAPASLSGCPVQHAPALVAAAKAVSSDTMLALRKREWLLNAIERQRDLSPNNAVIERRGGLSREEFLERYYAPGRPVILTGETDSWPARILWSPAYLRQTVGAARVEYQGGRTQNDRFEMYKDVHKREASFAEYIDLISKSDGNDAYITAYNSGRNAQALSVLHKDMGFLDKYLTRDSSMAHGMMWIGPAGTVTSLHHDLTNNFIAQIIGRKRVKMIPAADVAKLYNHKHVFSEIADLEDPSLDDARFPLLAQAHIYDVALNPGEILYVPLGWWHQVKSLDFSVTVTYTNFLWPNVAYQSYPAD